jgi:hypothetical protein
LEYDGYKTTTVLIGGILFSGLEMSIGGCRDVGRGSERARERERERERENTITFYNTAYRP